MEPNDRSYRHHPVIRDEDAAHAAIRRSASADVAEQFGDTGALENGHDQQRPNVEQTFPNKLHYMLDHGLEESERDVIAWQPHGRAFLVLDQRRFVTELLPNWFRQNKYQSFQRQLNSYGFQRITQGRDKGAYYHMSFVRGRRELCQNIKRVKIKGNGGRKPSNPETEPNFYLFPPVLPPPSLGSGTAKPARGADSGPGGAAKIDVGLASLLPPAPAAPPGDRPLAHLLSMGAPIQNPFPFSSSAPSHGGGAKPPTQDLSLLSFLSNAKNNAQSSQPGVASTPAHLPTATATAALSGAPYILTSTMGTAPPAPAFAPAYDAAASHSLQRSLLLQYSRRLEAEAQARERNQILALLLNATLPVPGPAASPPRGTATSGTLQRASAAFLPVRTAEPPQPVLPNKYEQQPPPPQGSQDAGEDASASLPVKEEQKGERGEDR